MKRRSMKTVVFLRWPEKCFRAQQADIEYLRSLLPAGSAVTEARSEREFLKALPDATHVIVWYFRKEWYALAPKLRLVATPAAGRELVAEPPPGGPAVHFGHYHGPIIAESVAAFCLARCRGFLFEQPDVWPRRWMGDGRCRELAGTHAVILGYGNIGRAIGSKLAALGVEVRGFSHAECDLLRNRRAKGSRLEELRLRLKEADWLILALPSDTGTDDLVDARLIKRLSRKCVLVNIGRGNAVDEAALASALDSGRLAGAYLDVLKYEPHYRRCFGFDETTEKSSSDFLEGRVKNAVVMPHSSAFSPQYLRKAFEELHSDGCLSPISGARTSSSVPVEKN